MWRLYEEFIYLLREMHSRWPWWIDWDRSIRTITPDGEFLDPLTAMYATVHQRLVDMSSYRDAARGLGLDHHTADAIAQASDLAGSYNAHVRADLIEAVQLHEQYGRRGRWNDLAFLAHPYPHGWDKPFRHGVTSGGTATSAWRKDRSRFTHDVPIVARPLRLIARIAGPVDAISISCVCAALPPAASSAFSVATSQPGCELIVERLAAD